MARNIRSNFNNKIPLIATASVITATVGSLLIEFLPHSIYLEKYKKLFHLQKYGDPVLLTKKIENLYNEVLNDLNIVDKPKNLYRPFPCIGFNVCQAGLNTNKFGSVIGLPVNYAYEDRSSVDVLQLRLGYKQEKLNVYHPAASSLVDSLLLSDKAKKFGIAREIMMNQQNLQLYRCMETPSMILATAFCCEYARIQLARSVSLTLKFSVYGIITLVGYGIWFQIRDGLNTYYEKLVDKNLAELNLDYVEGGKEFYEKQLQKNIALRALLGDRGVKEYNKDGDEIITIRRKRTPLTERKQFFIDFILSQKQQEAV
ncbi:PREDICTED: transmembrane protein 177 [Ceratosolen solmsi marchali]|uniref:Transmembrane protein 177 n=1 Tax=Ceratosolen solmsi marchali TaxID=326594 RepID=A0AAJ6VMM2_9HYME|nr:PREDICTED: transmembrane protein 177 [Ceratosolen solmsi marchali]